MKSTPFPILCAAALAACSSADDVERELGQGAVAAASGASSSAEAGSGGAVEIERETDDYIFGYSWPQEAGQQPKLAERLRAEADTAEADLAKAAAEARRESQEDAFPFRQQSLGKEWRVVAELPRWLSLSAEIATYTGGAHGNVGYDALVWDKQGETAREPLDFFRSVGNLENAIQRRFCEVLNGERARRRGELVAQDSEDMFEQCPKLEELTVLLGSSNGREFNRIGLIAAPYVAGPYAEGSYEVTLAVDTSVLDAVKPEYTRFFALGR